MSHFMKEISIFRPCDHPTPLGVASLRPIPQRQTRLGDTSENPPPVGRRRSHLGGRRFAPPLHASVFLRVVAL